MDSVAKCFNCDREFTPERKTAKFCSDTCRAAYSRKTKEGTVAPVEIEKELESFTPNWKRLGFKNQQEGMASVIKALIKGRHKILSKGLSGSTTFTLGGEVIILEINQVTINNRIYKLKGD